MATQAPFDRWSSDFARIRDDVTNLMVSRHIWTETARVINASSELKSCSSAFVDWIAQNYAASATVGVRRHTDRDSRSASMASLLTRVANCAQELTREGWIRRRCSNGDGVGQSDALLASDEFDNWADPGGQIVDADRLRADVEDLRQVADPIRAYVNSSIAHQGKDALEDHEVPMFKDLNDSLDLLTKLVRHYSVLFLFVEVTNIVPVFQFDWRDVFRHPWIARWRDRKALPRAW